MGAFSCKVFILCHTDCIEFSLCSLFCTNVIPKFIVVQCFEYGEFFVRSVIHLYSIPRLSCRLVNHPLCRFHVSTVYGFKVGFINF